MSGTRSKRQQEKARKAKRDVAFLLIGLALALVSLAFVFIPPEPNVYAASLLLLIGCTFFFFALCSFYQLRPALQWTFGILCLLIFGGADYWWIQQHTAPSFVFVVPGAWVNGNAWDFLVQHRGPETVFNVVITFMDDDKLRMASQAGEPLQTRIEFPEVSPHKSGIAKQFLWKPLVPDHEYYSAVIESRKANMFQVLNVERVNGQWVWETRITDTDHGSKTLLECKDSAFPAETAWNATLRPCFPDLLQPD